MRTELKWRDVIPPPKDSQYTNTVWAVCFKPDGTQVILAVADRIFIYDAESGEMINFVRGHKDTVYCLAYSKDGQRFASGGADSSVVIWSAQGEGLLKYSHSAPIQALAYNPVLNTLASCSNVDYGLWSQDQQNVNKIKSGSKCLCCDWTPDGQVLAIGLFNGTILLRDKAGAELNEIKKSTSPIWTLAFCP